MAVAYEAWRAKVHTRPRVTTTTACFTKKNKESKSCCSALKKKEEKKKKNKNKKPCSCRCTSSCDSSRGKPAVCRRVKDLGNDCCNCCIALCQFIGEYIKFFTALMCCKHPHSKFCCRLCNLLRATAIVWQDGCDMIRCIIQCILGMH